MKTKVYLMKEFNGTDNLGAKDVCIEGVIHLSIGQRLVYIEYIDEDALRIRAYGRDEFDFLGIDRGDNSDGHILAMSTINRLDMRFARVIEETELEDINE